MMEHALFAFGTLVPVLLVIALLLGCLDSDGRL
jgi:hypothetical protein